MKTSKLILLGLGAVMLSIIACAPTPALANVQIGASINIGTQPKSGLEVYVWPDRGEGSVYYPGDPININVQATRDCFLILYDIDTRGRLNILFPEDPWQNNFVAAGDQISFPRPQDDFTWSVEGPSGTEYVQAIASEIPITLPEWPVYQRPVQSSSRNGYDPELRDFSAGDDRYDYMNIVNRDICGRYWDWTATDVATFYVHPHQPIYNVNNFDPWPNQFYGEVYIGWPAGATIYIDGTYIGIAPCWIPRTYVGQHVITCLSGPRVIRRQTVSMYPKRDFYRRNMPGIYREYVRVKTARPGAYEHFNVQRDVKGNRSQAVERARVQDPKGSRYQAVEKTRVRDGSSGNSREFQYKQSQIEVRTDRNRQGDQTANIEKTRVRDGSNDKSREIQYKSSKIEVRTDPNRQGKPTPTFEKSRTAAKRSGAADVIDARVSNKNSSSKAERSSSKHRDEGKSERSGRRK
jgi:hypothetical protein